MMRKAISPLVAAVLLIAVTMSIAGILAYWASSWVKQQAASWENQTITGECQFADFKVRECSYNSTSKKMSLILENLRDIQLRNLTLHVIYANLTTVSSIPLNQSLAGNAINAFIVSGISSNYKEIEVTTHCAGKSVTDKCK